jgi:ferredoxin
MEIKKVWIEKGCTACGLCESICPEVFTVEDEAQVKSDVKFDGYSDLIIEAAESCPVEVIKYEASKE